MSQGYNWQAHYIKDKYKSKRYNWEVQSRNVRWMTTDANGKVTAWSDSSVPPVADKSNNRWRGEYDTDITLYYAPQDSVWETSLEENPYYKTNVRHAVSDAEEISNLRERVRQLETLLNDSYNALSSLFEKSGVYSGSSKQVRYKATPKIHTTTSAEYFSSNPYTTVKVDEEYFMSGSTAWHRRTE